MLSSSRPVSPSAPDVRFWWLLAAVTGLRLCVAFLLPLTGDEAYYWEYAHHLALGYHDHPPMVGWLIALSCALLGKSALTVRLPFVLAGAVTAGLLAWLSGQVAGGRAATWTGGLVLACPLFNLAGMAAFPDAIELLFVAGFFVAGWRLLCAPSPRGWLACGVLAGLALLCKLTAAYLMPSLFLYALVEPTMRRQLRTPWPWLACATLVLTASPLLYWNATHGWDSFAYQYGSRLGASTGYTTRHLVSYSLLSLASLSPVLGLLLMAATGSALARCVVGPPLDDDLRARRGAGFLSFMVWPIHGVFLLAGTRTKLGLHWAAAGTLAALALAGGWIVAGGAARRRLAVLSLATAVPITLLLYATVLAPATVLGLVSGGLQLRGVNQGKRLEVGQIAEVLAYPALAAELAALPEQPALRLRKPFFFTTNYTLSSALTFYSNREWHVIMGTSVGAEFVRWDDFAPYVGCDGVFVDMVPLHERMDVWEKLLGCFERVEELPARQLTVRGVGTRTFYPVLARGLRQDALTSPQHVSPF
jgi:4-amino-4-deoxy-L-arabinose transferase-like glycosyltransferase